MAGRRFSHLLRKFNSDQRRVPAGRPGGGQWTGGDGDEGVPRTETLTDSTGEAAWARSGSLTNQAYHFRPYQRVNVEAARGRLDEVRIICREELPCWPDNRFGNRPEEIDIIRLPQMICDLFAADDRAGLAALLHEWEATTVRNLKLEHLWAPTPFPLEQL